MLTKLILPCITNNENVLFDKLVVLNFCKWLFYIWIFLSIWNISQQCISCICVWYACMCYLFLCVGFYVHVGARGILTVFSSVRLHLIYSFWHKHMNLNGSLLILLGWIASEIKSACLYPKVLRGLTNTTEPSSVGVREMNLFPQGWHCKHLKRYFPDSQALLISFSYDVADQKCIIY